VHPSVQVDDQRPVTIALRETRITLGNKLARAIWSVIWLLLYRPSPILLHGWRRFLLRCFGARMGKRTLPYPSVRIWAPWNLTMADDSCLSHQVDCYCVDKIYLGPRVTVSQYSFLCTASHDHTRQRMPLVTAPIRIEADAWVTADVFISPGVTVGEGAVVGARSTVLRSIKPWTVVAGYPAREIGPRKMQQDKVDV
jgi:putative colanic acid biosynthesis acetyltransferase WcaF